MLPTLGAWVGAALAGSTGGVAYFQRTAPATAVHELPHDQAPALPLVSQAEIAGAERVATAIVTALPDALSVVVADVATGHILTHRARSAAHDARGATACYAAIVRQQLHLLEATHLTDDAIEDVFITLGTELHVLKVLNGGQMFVHLALPRAAVSIAIARAVLIESAVFIVR